MSDISPSEFSSVCSLGLCRKRAGGLSIHSGACSETGPVRPSNDDLVFAGDDCRLYLVLDGVGGHAGGGEASRIVLDSLRACVESMCNRASDRPQDDLSNAVIEGLQLSRKAMMDLASDNTDYEKMGTVFAMAFILDDTLYFTHVGDCRIYLIREGSAHQLTIDETFVQVMLDSGKITAEDIKVHPMRNVILNCVNRNPPDHEPSIHSAKLVPDDIVMLTTDGVTDRIGGDDLAKVVAAHEDSKPAAAAVVSRAIESGSRDNASCVVIRAEAVDAAGKNADVDLQAELHRLHEMLSDVQEVDDELRSDLKQVATDIQSALEQEQHGELTSLRERLNDSLLAFEVSHPHLTNIVSRISESLAAIGI